MNFDRNTVIGFVVLAVLFFGFFYFNSKEQAAAMKKKSIQDSIANAEKPKQVVDTAAQKKNVATIDSITRVKDAGQFQNAVSGTEQLVTIENDVFKIAFTNKGGQPKWVELKKFKYHDSSNVRLAASDFDKIDYKITTRGGSMDITSLFFTAGAVVKNGDSQTISFTMSADSAGPSITHQFVIKKDNYMIDFDIKMNGADQLLSQEVMNLKWQYRAKLQEKDMIYERTNTQVGYRLDGEFDYHTIERRSDIGFEKPVQWLAMRQRFFNTILVAKNNFSGGKMEWVIPNDSATVVQSVANMRIEAKGPSPVIALSVFYGPADYRILKEYNNEMGKLVNLGQNIYSFVRPLNKYVVIPVFDFFKSFVNSFGIAILLLTIFIRLIISPLTYSSYLSGAKMKALRPEIEKLKAKFGKDQQQMSMEQMKLFREAGVNPLGGCIPALLQIPIFFALYSFFNASVDLRGESFLWATDLSAYDSVLDFGFKIPLYGSHISLFTITACLTSFLISIYSMSMTPDQSNPVLKYMPYIFPFFLLFIFNPLPSALTWYYTVSNLVTLALQFVIQTYIIDHDKILKKMEENRKKPKTKSKWQEKFELMQEQQKKAKELPGKNKR